MNGPRCRKMMLECRRAARSRCRIGRRTSAGKFGEEYRDQQPTGTAMNIAMKR